MSEKKSKLTFLYDYDEYRTNVLNNQTEVKRKGKKGWLPAKPLMPKFNYHYLKARLKAAIAVMKGDAVAVKWH